MVAALGIKIKNLNVKIVSGSVDSVVPDTVIC